MGETAKHYKLDYNEFLKVFDKNNASHNLLMKHITEAQEKMKELKPKQEQDRQLTR